MSKAIPRREIMDACIRAIATAEDRYSKWSGGTSMRAAPESLAQTFIANEIAGLGVEIQLEASVSGLIKRANGKCKKPPRNKNGRVDIAVFWKSKRPRIIIEIKKISREESADEDHKRILKMLKACSVIQSGILVGYTMAATEETVNKRLLSIENRTGGRIERFLEPTEVKSRSGKARYLGAAVYRIDRDRG